jgi:hypothetical protein
MDRIFGSDRECPAGMRKKESFRRGVEAFSGIPRPHVGAEAGIGLFVTCLNQFGRAIRKEPRVRSSTKDRRELLLLLLFGFLLLLGHGASPPFSAAM